MTFAKHQHKATHSGLTISPTSAAMQFFFCMAALVMRTYRADTTVDGHACGIGIQLTTQQQSLCHGSQSIVRITVILKSPVVFTKQNIA